MAESLVDEMMAARAEDACADGNQRNGYCERMPITAVGLANLRSPKLRRGAHFPGDLLVRYPRADGVVITAVSETVDNGVSTREASKAACTLVKQDSHCRCQ